MTWCSVQSAGKLCRSRSCCHASTRSVLTVCGNHLKTVSRVPEFLVQYVIDLSPFQMMVLRHCRRTCLWSTFWMRRRFRSSWQCSSDVIYVVIAMMMVMLVVLVNQQNTLLRATVGNANSFCADSVPGMICFSVRSDECHHHHLLSPLSGWNLGGAWQILKVHWPESYLLIRW